MRQDIAIAIGHLGDQVGVDLVAAVGEHGVGARHLQRCHVAGAQGQGQVRRVLVRVKAETRRVFLAILGADLVQDADGNHVLRFHQALAHGHRAIVFAVVVFRFPRLAARLARVERDRRIVDDGRWRQAPFQRSGIDEGLEGGTWLAPRLGDVVELVAVVIEAAHHGADGAVRGAGRDERRLHFRHLRQDPGVVFLHDADHGAALDAAVRRRFVRQPGRAEGQAGAGNGDFFAGRGDCLQRFGRRLQHHGGDDVVAVRVVGQFRLDGVVRFGLGFRNLDVGFRAAVAVAFLVIHHALAQGDVGGVLIGLGDGGVDVQAARICIFLELFVDQLARHFRHVFRVHAEGAAVGLHFQLFIFRFFELRRRDVAQLRHALQNVLLAHARAFRIDDGVVGRRRLRQAGQHGRFGHGEIPDILAEIDLRGRGEAVGALSQINLVHIHFEDLVLAEVFLDFPRQQDFIRLALQGLFAGQEEIARHLLRDGRGALLGAARQVVQGRTRDAQIVDAAMFIETVIFDGQHGFLHDIGNILDVHHVASLLAELADQHTVGREHAQRHLWLVIGQGIERRQVRIGHGQAKDHQQDADDAQAQQRYQGHHQETFGFAALGGRLRASGASGV